VGRGRPGTGVEPLATSIRVTFTLNGKRCRETLSDLKPTPPNIKYATRLVADIKKQIAAGTFEYAAFFPKSKNVERTASTTLQTLSDKWLALHPLEHSTRIVYRNNLKVWLAAFGDRPISAITPEDIRKVIAERIAQGISAKSINNSLDPFRGVLTFAVESGVLASNPVGGIKRLKGQKAPPDPFSKAEMERILAWMGQHAPEEVVAWYTVAFTTGLRPSEQCVLRRDDISHVRCDQLRIERAYVRGKMKTTKARVVRFVDLSPRAMQKLTRLTGEWLFANDDGSFHTEVSLRTMHMKYWKPCLMELGIRYRSPYHTRHTFATVYLMAGVNPAYIARQLGHSTIELLCSTYSRWIDGADGGAEAAKMNAAFALNLPSQ